MSRASSDGVPLRRLQGVRGYLRHSPIQVLIGTRPQVEPVQSDVAFSGSYEERPIELGKLMLYQLSYTGSLNCGQVAASLETVDRPLLAVSGP